MSESLAKKIDKVVKKSQSREIEHNGRNPIMLTSVKVSMDKQTGKEPLLRFHFEKLVRDTKARLVFGLEKIPFIPVSKPDIKPIFALLSKLNKEVPMIMEYLKCPVLDATQILPEWAKEKDALHRCQKACNNINIGLLLMRHTVLNDDAGVIMPTNIFFSELAHADNPNSSTNEVVRDTFKSKLDKSMSKERVDRVMHETFRKKSYRVLKSRLVKIPVNCNLKDSRGQ